ncbi:flagellar hook-associated protein FlgK [Pseudogemmobacter sonorensis]|uniref:flagellar hook-associated protein FlgK n=1 Tax=Pseudogemmobacter sonorensis TaxID=2989681 RepID=UPI003687BD2C
MSISSAFASALSGLSASARQAETLSSNVANATTPGYVRREVILTANHLGNGGQGVLVSGITRNLDLFLLNDRRTALAEAAASGAEAGFLSRLESVLGDTEDPAALVNRINALDEALVSAASRPESEARLTAAVTAASELADALNAASRAIQVERQVADRSIGFAVERLNASLLQVEDLNSRIMATQASGRDASALMDERARIVDTIADLIPLREVDRGQGRIALISAGGAVLLDGKAAQFDFTSTPTITPEMTVASGGLSGLTLNGRPAATSGPGALLAGGELAALFSIRDSLAVEGQARLDALGQDLVERFSAAGVDPTLPAGAPGLFTDQGGSFDPLLATGLAARIRINAAVDPAAGGSVLRLRDGLGATLVGPEGDATRLNALVAAMDSPLATTAPGLGPVGRSLSGLAADLLSLTSVQRLSSESKQSFTMARLTALTDLESKRGVDLDAELQSLLVLEKTYAANARVLSALDEMLATLIGI